MIKSTIEKDYDKLVSVVRRLHSKNKPGKKQRIYTTILLYNTVIRISTGQTLPRLSSLV